MSHICDGRALSCVTCAAIARRHDAVRAVMTHDDRLDDIKRVQIWTRIEDRLAVAEKPRARWTAMAMVAVAATVVGVILVRGHRDDSTANVLTAPADATLSARLGPHTRATLVGPARLEVVGIPGAATTVKLRSGTLLAEFSGGTGRSLRVEAPGVTVDVVGTLFAVEARAIGTCVSVAHGKVQVTTSTGVIAVAGGESWCLTAPQVQPILPAVRDALERHEAVLTASEPKAHEDVFVPAHVDVPVPAHVDVPVPADVDVPVPAHVDVQVPARVAKAVQRPSAHVVPVPPRVAKAAQRPSAHVDVPAAVEATSPPHVIAAPWGDESPPPAAAPPVAAPVVAAPAAPPPVSAESLYEAAETALAKHDLAAADRTLARLVTDYPSATLLDQALYERARIAYQRHAWSDAQRHLDKLAALESSSLGEPGAYLSCRIAVEAHDDAAERCLVAYRKTYPRSPHDLDVLGLLVDLDHRAGGCRRAGPLVDELVRLYPNTTLARGWRTRCKEAP